MSTLMLFRFAAISLTLCGGTLLAQDGKANDPWSNGRGILGGRTSAEDPWSNGRGIVGKSPNSDPYQPVRGHFDPVDGHFGANQKIYTPPPASTARQAAPQTYTQPQVTSVQRQVQTVQSARGPVQVPYYQVKTRDGRVFNLTAQQAIQRGYVKP